MSSPVLPRPAGRTSLPARLEVYVPILLGLFYVLLIGHYRPFDMDTVWFQSFSHAWRVQGIQTDIFTFESFPAGMGGVIAFGKLPALVQGTVLNLIGWSEAAGAAVSIAFVTGGLLLLGDMCRRLRYPRYVTVCYLIFTGLMEPVVLTAQKSRYEFFAFFLLCLALSLAAREAVFLSAFVAALAVEGQPSGLAIFVAVAITLLVQGGERRWKRLPRIVFAGALALLVYVALHPAIFFVLRHADLHGATRFITPLGFFGAYYLPRRHLPDLLFLLAALAVAAWKRRALLKDWPFLGLAGAVAVAIALRWANPNYFCFVMPFLALFVVTALVTERNWKLLILAVALITLPQYVYRAWFWSAKAPDFTQSDERQVTDVIQRAATMLHKDPSRLHIAGNFSTWYAHPTNYMSLDSAVLTPARLQASDLVLCFDEKIDPIVAANGLSREIPCRDLASGTRELGALQVHGRHARLLVPLGRAPGL